MIISCKKKESHSYLHLVSRKNLIALLTKISLSQKQICFPAGSNRPNELPGAHGPVPRGSPAGLRGRRALPAPAVRVGAAPRPAALPHAARAVAPAPAASHEVTCFLIH